MRRRAPARAWRQEAKPQQQAPEATCSYPLIHERESDTSTRASEDSFGNSTYTPELESAVDAPRYRNSDNSCTLCCNSRPAEVLPLESAGFAGFI